MAICDFGYAKDLKSNPKIYTYAVGNFVFRAPEQDGNDKAGKASLNADSWSLAALFLHLLHPIRKPGTGKPGCEDNYNEHDDNEI